VTDAQILDRILAHEGTQYTDDPDDRGRCTKYGITLATLQSWKGNACTCDDVRRLSEADAREIYRQRYVAPFDGVEPGLKPQLVDIAVNSGVLRARTLLAQAEQTGGDVNSQLVLERLKFYKRIVKADPTQSKFLRGWAMRALEYL